MMSLQYARCSTVVQLRSSLKAPNQIVKWQLFRQTRARSQSSLCRVRRVQYVPVRHFFKRKPAEGVSFKPAHKTDRVNESFRLIFANGAINYYIYGVRSLYVCIVVVSSVIVAYIHHRSKFGFELQPSSKTVGKYTASDPLLFCIIGIPIIIVWLGGCLFLSKNVALRIYYDNARKEYAGRFLRYGLYSQTEIFSQREIRPVDKPGLYGGNISIKGRNVLINEVGFQTLGDFNRFMGYDEERASDMERLNKEEDVREMLVKGLKQYQASKYKSFEEKYHKKRKLRNVQ